MTEAIFKNGKRADVFVLDQCEAREVIKSETIESMNKKKKEYPCAVMFLQSDTIIKLMLKKEGIL